MDNTTSTTQKNSHVFDGSSDKQSNRVIEEKEEALLDFSSMFKKNGFIKRPLPKLGVERKIQSQGPNWLLEIPAKLDIQIQELEQRRFIDEQKWKMMAKTNNETDSPIAAFVSAFNYLVKNNLPSTFPQLTLKQMKEKLLNSSSAQTLQQLTRQKTILECIKIIQQQFKAQWLEWTIHQLNEENRNQDFLSHALSELKNKRTAFIYVCYGQVLCPVGFENTPLVPLDAYKKLSEIKPEQMQMWIVCCSPSKNQAPFVIKRWIDIEKEMTSRWPEFLDLNQTKKGRQTFTQEKDNQIDSFTKETSCWIEMRCSEEKLS